MTLNPFGIIMPTQRLKTLCLCVTALLFACGEQVTVINDNNSPATDMADQSADLSQDMTVDIPKDQPEQMDQTRMDMQRDINTMDMDMTVDMPTDMMMDMGMDMMTQQPYVGMTCTDGVKTGVCLEQRSNCSGETLPGACGQSALRCCVQSCTANGQTGLCSETSQCAGQSTPGLCPGPSNVQCCTTVDPNDLGQPAGTVWNTYYWLAQEADFSGSANTDLNDSNCNSLVKVSAAFSDAVCIEGSGRLKDGRVINYASTCRCGRACPTGGIVCYSVLDANRFPWGKGNRNNPLEPLRSLAVDRNTFANGTIIYLKEFDGITIPKVGSLGDFVHDGCFRADDVGGAIQGKHIDIFSGTPDMRRALEQIHPTRTNFTAYTNTPKCAYLK